ncbi:MAG: DUF4236 domain-containing protein [Planctomycetota bacterium]|nr:MAG: DUF4236 domain-containing protein [Planctomycetota bacterium]
MGFRFWRRVKIAPGITLNLSKSGASFSFGRPGARLTFGPRGTRATVGLPGTGLFYTKKLGTSSRLPAVRSPERRSRSSRSRTQRDADASSPEGVSVSPKDRLTLGFFQRLVTPDSEEAFVDGCRALVEGKPVEALAHFCRSAYEWADAAYMAGVLSLKLGRFDDAVKYLKQAAEKSRELGKLFRKYELESVWSVPITDHIVAHVGANIRGVWLALTEAYQALGRFDEAIACLEKLRRLEPDDLVVKVSLAELLMETRPHDRRTCARVVRLAEGVENDSAVAAALLLYKARALRQLGMLEAARETLTRALRRRKDRPLELLHALRYERAMVYEELGQHSRARADLQRIFAEDPDYEDVARRLGL